MPGEEGFWGASGVIPLTRLRPEVPHWDTNDVKEYQEGRGEAKVQNSKPTQQNERKGGKVRAVLEILDQSMARRTRHNTRGKRRARKGLGEEGRRPKAGGDNQGQRERGNVKSKDQREANEKRAKAEGTRKRRRKRRGGTDSPGPVYGQNRQVPKKEEKNKGNRTK